MLALWCAVGVAYVSFMFLVDVPMYWARWIADEAAGRQYLTVAQGFVDVAERLVISHHWDDWKSEIAWMSLYFSVAVWLSIALIHTPAVRVSAMPARDVESKPGPFESPRLGRFLRPTRSRAGQTR